MERHTTRGWVGSPPGYVGYDEGGQLTEGPAQALLRDSLRRDREGASRVFNMLLQILEDGRLSDAKGKVVKLR